MTDRSRELMINVPCDSDIIVLLSQSRNTIIEMSAKLTNTQIYSFSTVSSFLFKSLARLKLLILITESERFLD